MKNLFTNLTKNTAKRTQNTGGVLRKVIRNRKIRAKKGTSMSINPDLPPTCLPLASLSILSRLCLASLICAHIVLNHRARRSRSVSAPRTPSLSKPKVNWLLHTSLISLHAFGNTRQ